jgi:hypothetical protein
MAQCTVTSLTIYPLKGAQGIACDAIEVRPGGIVGDRELMLVKDGATVHQKGHPRLAQVEVAVLDGERRRLRHPKAGVVEHAIVREGDALAATLHHNDLAVCDQGDALASWACDALQQDGVRVVSLPRAWDRWIPLPQFGRIDGRPQERFYDVAPVLLNNLASLEDFNARTSEPVPMDRFRANVVVRGDLAPYDEDRLESLSGDAIELLHVNVCERCIMTTTDQQTGERPTKEPIKTLSTYRRIEDGKYASGVVFGLYMTPREAGTLRVGDVLSIARRA